jgi:hypothetical protein
MKIIFRKEGKQGRKERGREGGKTKKMSRILL